MTALGARARCLLVAAALAATTSACSADASSHDAGPPRTGQSLSGEITVFAAASLSAPFSQIGRQFESAHPGTRVQFNFAGSSDLVAQIQGGAPADVFASADTSNMDKVRDALARGPVAFASNTLEIAVPPGNPAGISGFRDLQRPGARVVVCAPQVPCGAAADKAAKAAGVTLKPVSEEQSVTDVLGKVASGEADAGLVYVTDVRGAGDKVEGIPFPQAEAAVNTYPIAALRDGANSALAQAFVDAVTGPAGEAVLASAGFGKAP